MGLVDWEARVSAVDWWRSSVVILKEPCRATLTVLVCSGMESPAARPNRQVAREPLMLERVQRASEDNGKRHNRVETRMYGVKARDEALAWSA